MKTIKNFCTAATVTTLAVIICLGAILSCLTGYREDGQNAQRDSNGQ